MPRSGSGVYTLPESAFISGTVIQSSPVNSDFNDIATALTQSLATTGVSTMTGPIKAASGTVTAPSYTFGGSTGTGFFLSSADTIAWTAAGVLAATFNSTGAVTWVGTQTAPTFAASSSMTIAGRPVTSFDVATAAVFIQTAAPTGWTKSVTHNDKTLRFVSGTASSGGSVDFSTLFARTAVDSLTLSVTDTPAHTHTVAVTPLGSNTAASGGGSQGVSTAALTSSSFGSGGSHVHNIDMRVKYVDAIIATKD